MRIATAATAVSLVLAMAAGQVAAQTRARMISGSAPTLPQAARDIGAQGIVKLSGVIGVDGKVRDLKIVEGTGSDLVDKTAFDAWAAATFEPARDAEGKAIEQPFKTSVDLLKDSVLDPKRDITRKTCAEFVLDVDWFTGAHPNAEQSDMPLYNMLTGTFVLVKSQGGGGDMLAAVRKMKVAWPAAYKECSKNPDKLFFEQLNKRMR